MTEISTKKILVVEDEKALSKAIHLKFEQLGFQNIIVCDMAEDALVVLEREGDSIGLIWLDLLLPQMNGVEFLEKIRKMERFKDIPVIVVSASGSPDTIDRVKGYGIHEYFVKSNYTLQEIIMRVPAILAGSAKMK